MRSPVEGLAGNLAGYHLFHAVRADLLRRLGRGTEAALAYNMAIAHTENAAEREFLRRNRESLVEACIYVGPVDIPVDEARRRASAARIAHLATVSASAQPHVVPVTFAVDGDTIVMAVDQKPKTSRNLRRLQNIRENPVVSVLVDHYDDEDWSALWWVRADGSARIVGAGEGSSAAAGRLLATKYRQYVGDPPAGPFILVAVRTWRAWQYAGHPPAS